MKISKNTLRGITIIEMLLVVAFVAIIGASASPFISRFVSQNNLETVSDKVVSSLRKAQSYSFEGKNAAVWGVCVSGSNIRLFTGTCGAPTFSEDFSFPASVSITGLSTITFSNLRGEPSSALSVTISNIAGSQTVTLNLGGGVDINP
jgi:type II secretory pathway pseudopilin PulG